LHRISLANASPVYGASWFPTIDNGKKVQRAMSDYAGQAEKGFIYGLTAPNTPPAY
jgi:hypothetical protein